MPLLTALLLFLYLAYQVQVSLSVPDMPNGITGNSSLLLESLPEPENENLVITIGGIINSLSADGFTETRGRPFFNLTVYELFFRSDLNIASLSAPFIEEGFQALNQTGARGNTGELAPLIKKSGINLLQLTGHHILDYGAPGLLNTLNCLENHDIASLGAGLNVQEAFTPFYFTKNGFTVSLLALNPSPPPGWAAGINRLGVASGNEEMISKVLEEMNMASQLSLVLVSFKDSHSPKASKKQQEFARHLVDMGARIVVGTGGGVVQETELYREGIIFYNLGNITAPPSMFSCHREGALLTLVLRPRAGITALAFPLQLDSVDSKALPLITGKELFTCKVFQRIRGNAPWERTGNGYFTFSLS